MQSVDILVTTKNRATELVLMMQSLRTQTFKNWNLFILDNASGTPMTNFYFINAMINRLKFEDHMVRIMRNNHDFGVCYARNLLQGEQVKYGWGKYSMRLDDDVVIEPDYIQKLLDTIDKGYDIASGLIPALSFPEMKREIRFLNGGINKVRINEVGDLTEFGDDCGYSYIEQEIMPAGHARACILYKSEINKKVQYPDTLSKYGFREESFWSLKAKMLGYKIGVHTGAIAFHLQTPSGGGRENPNLPVLIQQDDATFMRWIKRNHETVRLAE